MMAHLKEFEDGSTSTRRWLGKRRLALLFVERDALAQDLGPTHEVHVNVHHFGGHDPCTVINAYVDGSGPGLPAVMPRIFANEHASCREARRPTCCSRWSSSAARCGRSSVSSRAGPW